MQELCRRDREGLTFLKGPSAHRIGWACEAVPIESLGLHVREGVLSRWGGMAHEGSVGDEPMVSRGPEDGLAS